MTFYNAAFASEVYFAWIIGPEQLTGKRLQRGYDRPLQCAGFVPKICLMLN